MCVVSITFFCAFPSHKQFKNGQDILRRLIYLKGKMVIPVDPQDKDREYVSPSTSQHIHSGCHPSPCSPGQRGVQDHFEEETDYQAEFEQLLGGKVDTTGNLPSWVTSSSWVQVPPVALPAVRQSPETAQGTKSGESGQKKVGFVTSIPKSPLAWPIPPPDFPQ